MFKRTIKMNLKSIFSKVDKQQSLDLEEVVYLLKTKGSELDDLFNYADSFRKKYVGDDIYFRGIIEFSNYCKKNCSYCGIKGKNKTQKRYRLSDEEILSVCKKMEKNNQTTVVLQSGEDPYYNLDIENTSYNILNSVQCNQTYL